MMQKIVIEVQMRSRRRRAKAMKIAAVADGVNSVAFNEKKKDQMVIIGDGIDAASLALYLRKKVGHATLVTGRNSTGRYMIFEKLKKRK